jgi:hypothetical protein
MGEDVRQGEKPGRREIQDSKFKNQKEDRFN